jgi:DNA-binding LacI/PurR family transcriptional regulator
MNNNSKSTKPVTILDVARALDMHKSTVSLALSGKGHLAAATRERIMQTAREMGYSPNPLAQRLAGVGNNVVYLFSGVLDVGLATEKILIIQRELNRRDLEVPIYTCGEALSSDGAVQSAQVKQLCIQKPRAIICAAQMVHPAALVELENYIRHGGVVVSYDIPLPLPCDQVIFDREDNAYQAAKHLISRGHRKLGVALSLPANWSQKTLNAPQTLRLQGFKRALNEAHLSLHRDWIFRTATYESGGSQLAKEFLALPNRPTGLCIVNDYVAMAFMVEIMRAGVRVPEDVSLIGHDDQPIASYCPVPLTCVSQPVEKITSAVVELLSERLEGSTVPPRTVTIQGSLVQRQSVAAVAGH